LGLSSLLIPKTIWPFPFSEKQLNVCVGVKEEVGAEKEEQTYHLFLKGQSTLFQADRSPWRS